MKKIVKTALAVSAAVIFSAGCMQETTILAQEINAVNVVTGVSGIIMDENVTLNATDSTNMTLFLTDGTFTKDLWNAAVITSSNEAIATIEKDGFTNGTQCSFYILAIKPGTCTITLEYNGAKYMFNVTVNATMKFSESSVSTGVGQNGTATLESICDPLYNEETKTYAFNEQQWKNVTLTVSDDTIAEVKKSETEPGTIEVTGLKEGYCSIAAEYNGMTAGISVDVAKNKFIFGDENGSYSQPAAHTMQANDEMVLYAKDLYGHIDVEEDLSLLSCSSSNPLVASVTTDRSLSNNNVLAIRIKATSTGTTDINFSIGAASYMATITVFSEKLVPSQETVSLIVGETCSPVIYKTDAMRPEDILNAIHGLSAKSSNTKIASLKDGVITAKKSGTTYITYSYNNDFIKVKVTVTDYVTAKKSSNYNYTPKGKIKLADLFTVNADAKDASAVVSKVSSSNPSIVKVTKKGKCTMQGKGTTILSYTVDGHTCQTKIIVK